MNNRIYRYARPRKTKNGIHLPIAEEICKSMREHWKNPWLTPEELTISNVIGNIQIFSCTILFSQSKLTLFCAKMPDGQKKYWEIPW